ncbi:hypothetical protein DT076_17405 [Desertihabitans brevis]|uniref:Glycoside hydrolase n=2 Tax=Desertihabitans brevis TaxID=2268447 RepID=A0A367YQX4_9ACTN|nr:hypothetical protein DT076_17405 [Desertihabitans brevis]
MMRWWWFGPAVERAELDRELTVMAAAGLGGVEVAYVYPLEPATTTLLSESFLADLRFAAERVRELGLRFDLTLGTGWSFGGPHIDTALAARRLRWDRREITPGPLRIGATSPWPGEELVAAYLGDGSEQETPDVFTPLPVTDGEVRVPDGRGPRQVLLVWSEPTGQNVKRAAAGAEGPVLDHYSAAATQRHLEAFGDPLLDAVDPALVGSVFCDSLEVYAADWTPALPEEFERRRGYPLLPVLPALLSTDPATAAVRADYHRTLVELYEENFVAVVQRWAAGRGVPFRLQGYGVPPATVASYRFADLFEGEGWGWKRLTQTRWASSAAHRYDRPVVSAEVWTWLHSPSFRATPLDLQGEAHEHLLNGVNQLIGHGWPYSPPDAPGLGWFFYAAGAYDDRNPWWPAMPGLVAALSRLSWLLRQGSPVADVAVYVPLTDVLAGMGSATGGSLDAWRETARRVPAEVTAAVREHGLDYDLVDDEVLDGLDPGRYPVVVVPATTTVPEPTRAWLAAVQERGGTVLRVGSPVDVGGRAVAAGSLAAALGEVLEPLLVPDRPTPSLGVVVRRTAGAEVVLLANTGPEPLQRSLTSRSPHTRYEQWDPVTGRLVRAGALADGLALELEPYQATALLLSDAPAPAEPALPAAAHGSSTPLADGWSVTFPGEAPAPVDVPHVWEETGRPGFSGTARYATTVELDALPDGARVVLDLGGVTPVGDAGADEGLVGPSYRARVRGPVGEVATVEVNGTGCGVLWCPPYRVDVTDAVRPGRNEVVLEVANTAANALSVDEEIHRLAAEAERRDGRRFRMQQLDRAAESVRSGLLAAPTLRVHAPAPPG